MNILVFTIVRIVCLKLHWGQVTQSGVDTFVHLHLFQELLYLLVSIRIILIVRQVHLFFFDGAHQTFRIAILPRGPDICHTDSNVVLLQHCYISWRRVLHSLIGVMNFRALVQHGVNPLVVLRLQMRAWNAQPSNQVV